MADCCWVRIWLALILFSPGILSQAEKSTDVNIAFRQPVEMSSVEGASVKEHVVDGDEATCAMTQGNSSNRITIDLGEQHQISSIEYLQNASNRHSPVVYVKGDLSEPDNVCHYEAPHKEDFSCYTKQTSARYIIFALETKNLQLCEVRVNECKDGYFGNCSSVCRCRNDIPCDKASGLCANGCARGYSGSGCQDVCLRGFYGYDCVKTCHCKLQFDIDDACDSQVGTCSAGCQDNYYGQSCQTQLPDMSSLTYKPGYLATTRTSITINWTSWMKFLDPEYSINYQVEYKKQGTQVWLQHQPVVPHTVNKRDKNTALIPGLTHNTRYMFRIIPYLLKNNDQIEIGERSSAGGYFKTNCTEPNRPQVLDVKSSANIKGPMITVEWIKLNDSKTIHCDSISLYHVYYKRIDQPDSDARKQTASSVRQNLTIEGLKFDTNYELWLVAENNERLSSSSSRQKVETIHETAVAPEDELPLMIIIVVPLVALLIIAGIIGIICYRKNKYSPVAKDDPEDRLKINNTLVKADHDASRTEDSGLGGEGSSGSTPVDSSLEPVGEHTPYTSAQHSPVSPLAPEIPNLEPAIKREPILVSVLEDYVQKQKEDDNIPFKAEYKELPEGLREEHNHGKKEGNRHKNRFVNIIAYDHTRVKLEMIEEDPDSDYINANYIDGYKRPQAYIAAQGCTKYTIQDMWRMVWQEKSHRIIMATNLMENGKRKCEQYWPEAENEEKLYGEIGVTSLDIERTSDFVIRTFNIRRGEEVRNVKQFHFTAWPDHGAPNRASPIIAFRRKVRSFDETHPGVMTVHCSAGVGRTGTFIALDSLLDQAKAEDQVDVFNFTLTMRKCRVNMIQTVEQYVFLYEALLEALKAGNTAIPCSQFEETYRALQEINEEKGKSRLQEQYETLQLMSPKVKTDDCASGATAENIEKSRFSELLPADRYRPYLMTRVQGTNDFINAVFLDGYKSRSAYILTQMPLLHTVIDLWRMVYEHNSGSIVMLNPNDTADSTYGQYWPEENETCECGPFVIESSTVDRSNPNITVRSFDLQFEPESPKNGQKNERKKRKINQFQLHCWPPDKELPENKQTIIELIDLVERSQLKTGNGPIAIHCHDGVRQSGLFAAIMCIWEKMKVEHEVDIFHTVKQMRFHRPQIVHNMDQYMFCYDMVLAYLAEFEIYANFR